jgi:hypothetical protein
LPADTIQLTRGGFRAASPDILDTLRSALSRSPCVHLPQFLEPWLRDRWATALETAAFTPRVHKNADYWGGAPPNDLVLAAPDLLGQLLFLMNDGALFGAVERITGCDPIGSFLGVVYRFVPGLGHADRWHSDMDGNRMVAISVNLGREPFSGGHLQIKDAASGALLFDEPNRACGDAFLFPLSADLRHRVTELDAGPMRTVFTGWFVRQPSRSEWLRGTDVKVM